MGNACSGGGKQEKKKKKKSSKHKKHRSKRHKARPTKRHRGDFDDDSDTDSDSDTDTGSEDELGEDQAARFLEDLEERITKNRAKQHNVLRPSIPFDNPSTDQFSRNLQQVMTKPSRTMRVGNREYLVVDSVMGQRSEYFKRLAIKTKAQERRRAREARKKRKKREKREKKKAEEAGFFDSDDKKPKKKRKKKGKHGSDHDKSKIRVIELKVPQPKHFDSIYSYLTTGRIDSDMVTASNFYGLLENAHYLQANELHDYLMKIFREHFQDLVKQPGFPHMHYDSIRAFLEGDYMVGSTKRLEYIFRWAQNREGPEVRALIRDFVNVRDVPQDLLDKFVKESPDAFSEIDAGLLWQLLRGEKIHAKYGDEFHLQDASSKISLYETDYNLRDYTSDVHYEYRKTMEAEWGPKGSYDPRSELEYDNW